MKQVHLVGIGGVGMSALAQAFLDFGYAVTGADRRLAADPEAAASDAVLSALAKQGVALFPDDGSGVTAQTDEIVVSSAIEKDNPDLLRAGEFGIPSVHRAKALAGLLEGLPLVAVAGTCGKSTVTAILGHLLAECGLDPVIVNGAQIAGLDGGGSRVGSVRKTGRPPDAKPFAVVEVDESDKSLTAFRPFAAIVTNASADHYSEEEMNEVFDAFVRDVPGPVVDGRKAAPDVPETLRMAASSIPLPGAHNRANALLALRMAKALGVDEESLARAVKTFPGVVRRLQTVGVAHGTADTAVIDDYAHNPEKLAAMWKALADAYPKGVCVLWRPHGYGPLRKMADALADAFRAAVRPQDALLLLPVYDAGGTADRSANTDALAAKLSDMPNVRLLATLEEAEQTMRARAGSFGALVTAGARDPGLPILAKRLTERNDK